MLRVGIAYVPQELERHEASNIRQQGVGVPSSIDCATARSLRGCLILVLVGGAMPLAGSRLPKNCAQLRLGKPRPPRLNVHSSDLAQECVAHAVRRIAHALHASIGYARLPRNRPAYHWSATEKLVSSTETPAQRGKSTNSTSFETAAVALLCF